MDEALKVGDLVELKSGGPRMTVEGIGDYSPMGVEGRNKAQCVWFSGSKKESGVFELATLRKVQ